MSIWEPEHHRQWLGADNVVGFGLVTRDDVIQTKPDLVRRMVTRTVKGLDFIREHSAAEIADVVLGHPLTSQQFEGSRPLAGDWAFSSGSSRGSAPGASADTGSRSRWTWPSSTQIVKSPIPFEDFADTTWASECA